MSQNNIFSHLHPFSEALKQTGEILKNHLTRETFKNHQVFYSCSAPGMLSIEKV